MKTLVLGASTNPHRYSYKAANKLNDYGHDIYLVGKKSGSVAGAEIHPDFPEKGSMDTVTLYVGPNNQDEIMDKVIDLHPRRVIFNPGSENRVFQEKLDRADIDWEEACTLVLLSTDQY